MKTLTIPDSYKPPLRWLLHIGSLIPLGILIAAAVMDNLTANPIQAAMQRTGLTAIILLTISLSGTPLHILTHDPFWRSIRKPLGLYAFLYASIHMLIFILLDFNLNLSLLIRQLTEKPFIWFGLAGFLLLASLAFTSIRSIKKKMGKNWKPLHRFVYLTAILVLIHDALAQKANPLQLQGNVIQPLIVGGILFILLLIRLPWIKNWFNRSGKAKQS